MGEKQELIHGDMRGLQRAALGMKKLTVYADDRTLNLLAQ
jgi:hypothetical protein